jgi:hypothetical protein
MPKKRASSRRRGMFGGMNSDTKRIVGSMGYAIIGEPVLDNIASRFGLGISDDIIKGLAGYFVSVNTSGVIKAMGESAISIASYKVAGTQFGDLLGNLGTKQTQQNNNSTTTKSSNSGATF